VSEGVGSGFKLTTAKTTKQNKKPFDSLNWPEKKYKVLSETHTKAKRAKGLAQVVEHQPSTLEALSSIPSYCC
jgi:hypothetical protein